MFAHGDDLEGWVGTLSFSGQKMTLLPRGKLKYKNQTHNLLTHQELTCKSPRTRLFRPLFEPTCRVLLPLTVSFVWGKKKKKLCREFGALSCSVFHGVNNIVRVIIS